MRFASPWFALLFLVLVFVFWYRRRRVLHATVFFPNVSGLKALADSTVKRVFVLVSALRYLALIIVILALMRPQLLDVRQDFTTQGIDIMLVLDVSESMRAEDFKPDNRLVVAKQTLKSFVDKRETDRIGLVVFGGDAYTACPLTLDYDVLQAILDRVEIGSGGDGTAIGMAIATGLNRMKTLQGQSRVMIVLTDGENNAGVISPQEAAQLAQQMGVKVYTVGVGKEGGAPIPIDDPRFGRVYARNADGSLYLTRVDEATLKQVAQGTGAQYFRAVDTDSLNAIYSEINQMEKVDHKGKTYVNARELFVWFVAAAFCLFILELLIRWVILRVIP